MYTEINLAIYAIAIRGSEYDLPPDIMDSIVAKSISEFSREAASHRPIKDRRNLDSVNDEEEN